jgi:hypothetical protein
MRFETPDVTSAVMVANLDFNETEGRYDMVVEQGKLEGRGELVYGVFGNLTTAALQPELEALFDAEGEGAARRISNWLRMPLDWGLEEQPLASASEASSPPKEKDIPLVQDMEETASATPRPRLTPVPLEDRDWPVWVALPLKNGGILRGNLSGMQDGRLVVQVGSQRILFDPARLKHSPRELLAEAQSAYAGGGGHSARQYAAAAMLLLENPAEAKALFDKCK